MDSGGLEFLREKYESGWNAVEASLSRLGRGCRWHGLERGVANPGLNIWTGKFESADWDVPWSKLSALIVFMVLECVNLWCQCF